jgi:preprotein translocase SecE subunit
MKFEIYKKGQGALARWVAAIGGGVILLLGCYRCYWWLQSYVWASSPIGGIEIPGFGAPLNAALIVAILLVLGSALLVYYAVNRPDLADLLIDTEGEMRKVTWPTLEEAKNSSLVVIVCVVIMGVLITVFDALLRVAFTLVGIG